MMTKEERQAYIQASQEVDLGIQDQATWIKALAEADGSEDDARYLY